MRTIAQDVYRLAAFAPIRHRLAHLKRVGQLAFGEIGGFVGKVGHAAFLCALRAWYRARMRSRAAYRSQSLHE